MPGLVNGTTYTVRVAAVNDVGAGAWSEPVSRTPGDEARAPRRVAATRGDGSLAVTWAAPAESGGAAVEGYVVQWHASGQSFSAARQRTTTSTSATVPGLVNGTTYTVRVAAVNGVGAGAWSEPVSRTPATRPGAPVIEAVDGGSGRLVVRWAAPANGGSPVRSYQLQWKTDSQTFSAGRQQTATTTTGTISGLADGTAYWVRVAAVNGGRRGGVVRAGVAQPRRQRRGRHATWS